MPEELPQASPPRGRTLRRAILVVVTLCVLGCLCLVAISLWNRSQLQRALSAIEARGQPVVLAPSAESDGGRSSREWLQRFENARGDEEEWSLSSDDGIARFLESPEGRSLDSQSRAELEQLRACLASDALGTPEGDCNLLLADGCPPERWTDCRRRFLRTRGLAFPRLMGTLRAPVPTQPLDPRPGEGLERIPDQIACGADAERALLTQVACRISTADKAGILACIEGQLRVAALFDRQPGTIALQARLFFRQFALASTRIALAQFSPELDLEPIDAWFAQVEEDRDQFRRALLEDRAIGNECYAEIACSGSLTGSPKVNVLSTFLCIDQSYYLSTYAEVLEIVANGRPASIGGELEELQTRMQAHFGRWSRYTTPLAGMLLPRFTQTWGALRDLSTRIELVRLALRVRRTSVEEARKAISLSSDPLGEGPFHVREESEGLLAIWSVGRNGRDDGAPTELELEQAGDEAYRLRFDQDDLVVRARMR